MRPIPTAITQSLSARIQVKTYPFSSILRFKITLTSRGSRDMRAQLHHLPAELGLAAISIGKSYADWREPGRAFCMRRYNSNRFQRKVASGWLSRFFEFPSSNSSRLEGFRVAKVRAPNVMSVLHDLPIVTASRLSRWIGC